MGPLKIAMFTDSYKPQINGVVTSIEISKKYLERKGHEVTIFAPAVPRYKDTEIGIHRFKSVSFMAHKEYRIGIPVKFLTGRNNFDFDVIHVHTPFSIGALALGLKRKYHVPCVGTFHTLFSEYMHYFIKPQFICDIKEIRVLFDKLSWKYLPWFYNQMDSVISPSEDIRNLLLEKGVRKDIFVVPTGIKDSMISRNSKTDCRKKFGFGKERIILHVGRISKEKNIGFIVNSLKDILEGGAKLVITSEGPEKQMLENLVKGFGIEKSVVFTGYMNDDEIADMYKASDVFVMTSKSETQGIVLSEAAANGLPAVVLDNTVVSRFVEENNSGIISVEDEFSNSVEKILCDRKKYGNNALSCSKKFSPEKFTDNLIKIYKSSHKS